MALLHCVLLIFVMIYDAVRPYQTIECTTGDFSSRYIALQIWRLEICLTGVPLYDSKNIKNIVYFLSIYMIVSRQWRLNYFVKGRLLKI